MRTSLIISSGTKREEALDSSILEKVTHKYKDLEDKHHPLGCSSKLFYIALQKVILQA